MRSWTQLLEAWEKNPDRDAAIALCEAFGSATDPTALPAIGKRVATRHASDAQVLVVLGRALLSAGRIGEAQSVLVSAGKAEPKRAEVYRWLGEVLLLRGDAERATKVLDRAVSLGKNDEETTARRDRAKDYIEIQQRYGATAVAEDVAQQSAGPESQPDAEGDSDDWVEPDESPDDDDVTVIRAPLFPHEPPTEPSSEPTFEPVRPAAGSGAWSNPHPPALPSSDVEPRRTGTLPPPPMVSRGQIPEFPAPSAVPRTPAPPAASAPSRTPAPPAARSASLPPPPRVASFAPVPRPSPAPAPVSRSAPVASPPPPPAPTSTPPPPAYTVPDPVYEPPTVRKGADAFWKVTAPPSPFEPPPAGQTPISQASRLPAVPKRPPNAADVLDSLAAAGVFETSDQATYAWATPETGRTRFLRAFAVLTIVLLGAGAGGFYYLRDVRQQRTVAARMLDVQASISLSHASRLQDFEHVETEIAHAFDVSPSGATSLLWAKERFLRSLLADGDTSGIASAITRAQRAGIADTDLAFARIGSSALQGDVPGGAMLAARLNERASKDPLFQLAVGTVLERAGDSRAVERYELAVHADPDLLAAQVMRARAVILEGDPTAGIDLARAVLAKWPDRVEGSALVALAWLNDAARGVAPPENARVLAGKNDLCLPLRAVPALITAIERTPQPNDPLVDQALDRALLAADTASFATVVGQIALRLGRDPVTRRAAQRALSLVPTHGPARLLAAKAAFSAGELFEADEAIDGVKPASSHVALVKAAAAYERMDVTALADLIDALPAEVRAHPDLAALTQAGDLARSPATADPATLLKLASREIPWGEIVVLDVAMDSGNLALAQKVLDGAPGAKGNPSWALRRARFLRLSQRAAEADEPSKLAVSSLRCQRTVLERVLVLFALSKVDEARRVVTDNTAVLGPVFPWLQAYVEADGPRAADMRANVDALTPLPATTALQLRVVPVMALARLRDKARGALLIKALAKPAGHNPDFIAAAIALR